MSGYQGVKKPGYKLVFADEDSLLYGSKLEITSSREFVQLINVAPMIDRYGLVDYRISFDIKTASPTPGRVVTFYAQNGSGTRYGIGTRSIPVTQEFVRHEFTFRPAVSNSSEVAAWLAVYGVCDTGNIPTVRNVTFEVAK